VIGRALRLARERLVEPAERFVGPSLAQEGIAEHEAHARILWISIAAGFRDGGGEDGIVGEHAPREILVDRGGAIGHRWSARCHELLEDRPREVDVPQVVLRRGQPEARAGVVGRLASGLLEVRPRRAKVTAVECGTSIADELCERGVRHDAQAAAMKPGTRGVSCSWRRSIAASSKAPCTWKPFDPSASGASHTPSA